jgi:hypothetical protein
VGEDVSLFISKLTDMEKRLYQQAAITAATHQSWKLYGNCRWIPHKQKQQERSTNNKATSTATQTRTVTPPIVSTFASEDASRRNDKRARTGN